MARHEKHPEEVQELIRYLRRHYNVLTRDVAAGIVSLAVTILALGIVLLSTPLIVAGAGGVALLTIFAIFPAPDVEVTVSASPLQCRVGDNVTIILSVRADRGIGATLLALRLPRGFQIVEGDNVHLLYKGLGRLETSIVLRVRAARSGIHEIGPLVIESYHIAGLGRVKRREVRPGLIVEVRPRFFKVKKTTRTRIAATMSASVAIARSRLLGAQSTEFREIRRYVPGDPLKHINWKATARSGQGLPLVNEYERETLRRVVVVPDVGKITSFESLFQTGTDYVYSLALSLASSFLERGYVVYFYNPVSGKAVRLRQGMWRTLLRVWRECAGADIGELTVIGDAITELERLLKRVRGGLTVIVLITYVCSYTEPLLKLLTQKIRERRDVVLLVIDLDNETYVRNRYRKFGDAVSLIYRAVKDSYRDTLRRHNVIVLKADMSQSPTKILRQVLGLV